MTSKEIEKTIKDIKSLKIQGNTNIAKVAVKAILDYITYVKVQSFSDFISRVKYYCYELANARPNEPLTYNAMNFIIADIESSQTQQQARVKVVDRIQKFFSYIDESFEIIQDNAFNILKNNTVFMTHCHSSLVRDVIIRIAEINPNITVINTETRPLFQGRITARKLTEKGIKVIHIVDSAVSSILLDEQYIKPDVILVGSDGITIKGDLVNKVGTYNIAVAAKTAKIPLYVITQSMKLDLRSINEEDFKIENRDPREVWDLAGDKSLSAESRENIQILNPAFDLVPAKYITGGYITEKGLLEPKDFREMIDLH